MGHLGNMMILPLVPYICMCMRATDIRETVSKDNWKETCSIRNENWRLQSSRGVIYWLHFNSGDHVTWKEKLEHFEFLLETKYQHHSPMMSRALATK